MAVSLSLAAMPFSAQAADKMPVKIGDCARTTITEIGNRLGHTPGSGSLVMFALGFFQVDYDQIPEVDQSKVGDPVRVCLVELPGDCPPGDERGKIYKTVNLRTHKSWTMADSSHMCGGA